MNKKRLQRKLKNSLFFVVLCASTVLCANFPARGENSPCRFDARTKLFAGSAKKQARCLLRPVRKRGVLGDEPKKLPAPLEKLVGEKVKIGKEIFRRYLAAKNISETDIGGSLDDPLAKAEISAVGEIPALYFVIHDTSTPNYKLEKFPADINEKSWRFNDLQMWLKNPVAHVFINRRGESLTATPFSEPVKKGFGTKFARDFLKNEAKALQIHIELVQPRRSDAEWFTGNDAVAPEPGFTDAQYERLAIIYVAASIRRGTWLIPAFHCAVDAGIKDAHDIRKILIWKNSLLRSARFTNRSIKRCCFGSRKFPFCFSFFRSVTYSLSFLTQAFKFRPLILYFFSQSFSGFSRSPLNKRIFANIFFFGFCFFIWRRWLYPRFSASNLEKVS
jgi:hypothetical protein